MKFTHGNGEIAIESVRSSHSMSAKVLVDGSEVGSFDSDGLIDLTRRLLMAFVHSTMESRELARILQEKSLAVKEHEVFLNIGGAVGHLRTGRRLRRSGWNGKGMYVELQTPDVHSKMSLPYVFMKTADGQRVPWVCSQTDLLAEDWELVPDQKEKNP